MLAVVSSKGQLPLPKEIRAQLGLKAGSRLDLGVNERGWLLVRPVTNNALGLAGLLRHPGQAAVSIEAMAEAGTAIAVEMDAAPRVRAAAGERKSPSNEAKKVRSKE